MWPYDIGLSSSRAWIKDYDVGYDMGWKKSNSTWATTCIKQLIVWSYDIGFSSFKSWIKDYDVGYELRWKNLNSEIQAERNEWKSNIVSKLIVRDLSHHMHQKAHSVAVWYCIFEFKILNQSLRCRLFWIKAYDVGYDKGWRNLNSESWAERNEWKGNIVS